MTIDKTRKSWMSMTPKERVQFVRDSETEEFLKTINTSSTPAAAPTFSYGLIQINCTLCKNRLGNHIWSSIKAVEAEDDAIFCSQECLNQYENLLEKPQPLETTRERIPLTEGDWEIYEYLKRDMRVKTSHLRSHFGGSRLDSALSRLLQHERIKYHTDHGVVYVERLEPPRSEEEGVSPIPPEDPRHPEYLANQHRLAEWHKERQAHNARTEQLLKLQDFIQSLTPAQIKLIQELYGVFVGTG